MWTRGGVKESAKHCCSSAVSGRKGSSNQEWQSKRCVCVCGPREHVCHCILLVWLITEVVTHGPKGASVSVCSLDTADGENISDHVYFLVKFCSTLSVCCPPCQFLIKLLFFICFNLGVLRSVLVPLSCCVCGIKCFECHSELNHLSGTELCSLF